MPLGVIMKTETKIYLVVFISAVFLRSVCPVPVTKCEANDTKCLRQSTQALLPQFANGIPEYNVQTLDPLHVKSVDASSPNLKLLIKDMVVTGLKNCIAKKIERTETKLVTKLLCTVRADGHYEMNGRLLILPMVGHGRSHVILNKILINVVSDVVSRNGKDGKKHWHIKNSSYTFELKDQAKVHFENLFKGTGPLAEAAEDLINNHGNDIVVEVGPPVIKVIVDKIVENINHFYRSVPVEDLALE